MLGDLDKMLGNWKNKCSENLGQHFVRNFPQLYPLTEIVVYDLISTILHGETAVDQYFQYIHQIYFFTFHQNSRVLIFMHIQRFR